MPYFSAGLSTESDKFSHSLTHAATISHDQEEPFQPTTEIEAQTIGNLLSDEEDLFPDVFNELEANSDANRCDTNDYFDLFSSIGGMELERDNVSCRGKQELDCVGRAPHFCGNSKGLVANTNKLIPSFIGGSNQCVMRKCSELERDGSGRSKSANDFLSSQNTFNRFGNGPLKESYPASQNVLSDRSSSILRSLPSSLKLSSAGDHFGQSIPRHSLEFGQKYISNSEPHLFLDSENNPNYFIPNESSRNVAKSAGLIAPVRKNIGNISAAGSNRQPIESQRGIIGPLSNDICPVHGHPWCKCYLFHNSSLSCKVWPNSPAFSNIVNAPSPPQNSENLAYYSGSLNNMGPLSSSYLQSIARGLPVFSHSAQNCKKGSLDMNSSPRTAHSLGSYRGMWGNLSRRRNQGSSSHTNTKEFELDIERILCGEDHRTTLMLKNIPNKYTSKLLLAAINEHCRGTYDFVYLPIDFTNNCSVGYAFINMISPLHIVPFYEAFNGLKWEKFHSEKVAAVAYARIQGKAALIAHFQKSSLMKEDKSCHPILFCTDGPNAGQQEPFPLGTNTRVEAYKGQGRFQE